MDVARMDGGAVTAMGSSAKLPEKTPALPPPDDPEPPDESPYKKLYIAIDGVDEDDFDEAELERLQQRLIEYLLTEAGKPITNVRALDGDEEGVVEIDAYR